MAVNPLTFLEMEAFERKMLVSFNAWEAALIMRMDDAIRAVWASEQPKGPGQGNGQATVPINDSRGLRGLLKGLRSRLATK